MQVHQNINQLPVFKNAVITVGTFDGVHTGHRKLIEKISSLAKQNGGESVLITFEPHPRLVLNPEDTSLKLLSTQEEKIRLLAEFSINHLVIAPFTLEFSKLIARDYVNQFIIDKFHPSIIVLGYNHHFGHYRDGNIELLKKLTSENNFSVEEISKQLIDEIEVSSTKIRISLQEGNLERATELLGRYYSLSGKVIHANQLGRKIGFPTANIELPNHHKLIPREGVYAVKALLQGDTFNGMMNIGNRPTFDGTKLSLEVHLFNFDKDIYDETIEVSFVKHLRDEQKFNSVDELIAQLKIDKQQCEKLFTTL